MATKLEIFNMALSAARGQGVLTSIDQATRGAAECRKWYDLVIEVVQEAAYWPCCKARHQLVEADQHETADGYEYLYAYDLPDNLLRPWYLGNHEEFSLESHSDQNRLLTNSPVETWLVYAQLVTDTGKWTPAMTQAVVYGLGYKVCESLTGKDALVERLLGLANSYLATGQSTSLNSTSNETLFDEVPDWIAARFGDLPPVRRGRYFYPFGEGF